MCKKGMSVVPPKGTPVRQAPRFKSVRLNIEKNDISMVANMGGRPVSVNFDTKKIKKIIIQPVKIKKLFRQVDAEQIVFEFSEMPRIPGMPLPTGSDNASQAPPQCIFEEKACGKEFDIYKRLLSKLSVTNGIEFSDLTVNNVSEKSSMS